MSGSEREAAHVPACIQNSASRSDLFTGYFDCGGPERPLPQDAKPVESDRQTTVARVPGAIVPTNSSRAPKLRPTIGTTRRPKFSP